MDTVNLNIKFIRKQQGLTQQAFANLIDIKRSSLGAYEEGRAKPNYDTLQAISSKFNISIDKLLKENLQEISSQSIFGNGSATLTTARRSKPSQKTKASTDVEGKKLRVLSITVGEDNEENIELVPDKAAAGYLDGYKDQEYIASLPKFRLPFLPTGTYRAFEIKGDSMLPVQPGSIVIGEYVENWTGISNNQAHIVVSESEGLVFKRITNNINSNKTLTLRSDNPAYPPYTIKVDDVVEVWQAKAFISKEMPTNDTTLEKVMGMVMELQQEVIKMKKT